MYSKYPDNYQYCGGYPAIFGGTKEGESSILQVLEKEVDQESRSTYQLLDYQTQYLHWNQVCKKDRDGNYSDNEDVMFFYYSEGWEKMTNNWPEANSYETAEMEKVVTVSLNKFNELRTDDRILTELIRESQATAPGYTHDEFRSSETAKAFVQFIRSWKRTRCQNIN